MTALYVGSIVGWTAILFLAAALVVGAWKVLGDGRHELGGHLVGAALVWLVASIIRNQVGAPVGAYFVTLIVIYSYRRTVQKPPSGWYRMLAGLTAVWIILLVAIGTRTDIDPESPAAPALAFAVVGMMPWLFGWLCQWIWRGFRARQIAEAEMVRKTLEPGAGLGWHS